MDEPQQVREIEASRHQQSDQREPIAAKSRSQSSQGQPVEYDDDNMPADYAG